MPANTLFNGLTFPALRSTCAPGEAKNWLSAMFHSAGILPIVARVSR
jgi:hypothetical protein